MLRPLSADRSPRNARRVLPWLLASGLLLVAAACSSPPSFNDSDSDGSDSDGSDADGSMAGSNTGTGGGFSVDGDGSGGTSSGGTTGVVTVCGNGVLEIGELCDDGGEADADGCSGDCLVVDPDYLCLEAGEPCQRVVTCGNGILEGNEGCDDGNEGDDDGCPGDCSDVMPGYSCPKPGVDCVLDPVCGNGTRERGEGCDDGEATPTDGDGCDAACQQEPGFFCPPSQACVELVCGDGNRTPDEACDDGDVADGDGCSASCSVEAGWYCSSSGCKAVCGDGVILGLEVCDDGGKVSGDGCSAACKVEPFFTCDDEEPTVCISDIECGNGTLDPGEVCDPGSDGDDPCYDESENPGLACQGFETVLPPAICDDGVLQYGELCDGDGDADPLSGGCVGCVVQPGFICPKANYCVRQPDCGDGFITFQSGETCDAGIDPAEGCVSCLVEPDYYCSGEPSVCVQSICGDGFRAPDEQCDNGPGTVLTPLPPVGGDGCSTACTVEAGWVCPPAGTCRPICGDGEVNGTEQCDTPHAAGCTNCQLNAGYDCGDEGTDDPCIATVCGNGSPSNPQAAAQAGEGCDDGNLIAGDGCGPTCDIEPVITPAATADAFPSVATTCGDGLKTGTEQCDDGNLTDGDGCSGTVGGTMAARCMEETGWDCVQQLGDLAAIDFKIVYRDFKHRGEVGGHPHMKQTNVTPPNFGNDLGITGAACTTDNTADCGRLDNAGKPTYVGTAEGTHVTIDPTADGLSVAYHQEAFKLWYRDGNSAVEDALSEAGAGTSLIDVGVNPAPMPVAGVDTIQLLRQGGTGTSEYRFSRSGNTFYPLGCGDTSGADACNPVTVGRGYGYTANATGGEAPRNWNWTSELRYFFQYQGGETLVFFGDDDVFVFVNGRLAVDIGGIHTTLYGRVVLGDDGEVGGVEEGGDGNCSVHGQNPEPPLGTCLTANEEGDNSDDRFNLVKGNVYEIVVFQAERSPVESNYQLTLDGFLAPRSFCTTECGDDEVGGPELCDDGPGMPASGYGVCLNNCTFQFCGDGTPQLSDEDCDDGTNGATYGDGFETDCAPGCTWAPYCGDGVRQSAFEECDDGTNDGSFGTCNPDCTLAPYCGDEEVEAGEEECDPVGGGFVLYDDGTGGNCGYDCQFAPNCGDGTRNGPEICDDGPNNGIPPSLCNESCEFAPFCGDGLKTMDEECDYGEFASEEEPEDAPYGGCTDQCLLGPYCGDETIHDQYGEECDEGEDNDDNEYDGCTLACLLGPHCGDGTMQAAAGEDCDNGFNEDVYAYPGTSGACGVDCNGVPYCGDGDIQTAFELCDDGVDNDDDAYDGCTTVCDWGPYCGDGTENGPEECDDGTDNVAYSPSGEGCSYDCDTDVPYCGDGERNGPEECDLGSAANDGEYGGCNEDCTRAPFCGDYEVQSGEGEQCDDGPTGSLGCSAICAKRDTVK